MGPVAQFRTEKVIITISNGTAYCDHPCAFDPQQLRVSCGDRGVVCTGTDLQGRTAVGHLPVDSDHFPLCSYPTKESLVDGGLV